MIEQVYLENKEIIVAGDFNIDMLQYMMQSSDATNKPQSNGKLKRMTDICQENGLIQIIDAPTRITAKTSTLIDHIYVSNPEHIIHSSVPVNSMSDHFPVCITWYAGRKEALSAHKTIQYRCMKNFDLAKFQSDLMKQPWHTILCTDGSPDHALEKWSNMFRDVLNVNIPVRSKRVKHFKQPEWMNQEILNAINMRNYFKKTKNTANYKHWRNKVVKLIRTAKSEFYIKAIENNPKKTASIWKHIKGLCPNKVSTGPTVLKQKDTNITDTTDIANTLNHHYSTVATQYLSKIQSNVDPEHRERILSYVNSKIPDHEGFSIPPIEVGFVHKYIRSLDSNKATGLDGFSAAALKMSADIIAPSLTHICNLSLITGQFPSQWKQARIAPIFKNGARDECKNYRPISILPTLSKVIEKHVFIHLYNYLNNNNLITDTQFGFRPNHSCQNALMALTEQVYASLYENKYVGAVQLDLSKAFDLVNHKLLLEKLHLYKCNDLSMFWFESYLTGRSQCVKINNVHSDYQEISAGVPQGSILGPLMFLLYMNDLPLCMNDSNNILYADDVTLLSSHKNVESLQCKLSNDVLLVTDWFHKNDMVLSINKCQCMLMSSRQKLMKGNYKNVNLNVTSDTDTIQCAKTTKILGVLVDQFLSWEDQIEYIKLKIVRNLHLLKKIKVFLPLNARKMFYNSYILPHFDYCSIIWGNCSKTLLRKLITLQKKAARIILDKDNRCSSKVMFPELNWVALEERISYNIATEMYKCMNNLAPKYFDGMFKCNADRYQYKTRSADSNNVYVQKGHLRNFANVGSKIWNNIPLNIKNAKNLGSFKTAYLHHYHN